MQNLAHYKWFRVLEFVLKKNVRKLVDTIPVMG